MNWRFLLMVPMCMLVACGDPQLVADPACPTIDGERHVAEAKAAPAGETVMLHQESKACPTVGQNDFRLVGGSSMAMAPGTHMAAEVKFAVKAVSAHMPGHGHGTAEAPQIDAADPQRFSVAFQMPGDWTLDVEFTTETTSATQTVSFALVVR